MSMYRLIDVTIVRHNIIIEISKLLVFHSWMETRRCILAESHGSRNESNKFDLPQILKDKMGNMNTNDFEINFFQVV